MNYPGHIWDVYIRANVGIFVTDDRFIELARRVDLLLDDALNLLNSLEAEEKKGDKQEI
jgi:hypothetical protein